jgi:hypothetical protein
MRVTVDQFKQGIARYLDSEITSRLQGFKRWLIPLGAVAVINAKIDALMSGSNLEMIKATGYVGEDGMIDIDRLYSDLVGVARTHGSVTENLPMLGDVTFSESDIEALRRYIQG